MRLAIPTSVLLLPRFSSAQPTTQNPIILDSDCHNACTALIDVLGASVFYDPSSSVPGFRDSFYSTQQRDVVPACIVTPNSPEEVAEAIKMIRQHNCIFAVKSGGHAMFVGASNAPSGITIDMSKINDIEVSEDLEWARVGTGNRWRKVYEKLEPFNRTAVGGRNADVGVGGFILGGGISFVARRYGWATDNVRNFQIVLANGTLANVNQESFPDLFWALRGGGNNFGVVTNFDLDIHPQGDVWAGQNFWLMDPSMIAERRSRLNIQSPQPTFSLKYITNTISSGLTKLACRLGYCVTSKQAFNALRNIARKEQNDAYAHMWMSYTYMHQIDQFIFGAALVYSKPEVWPAVFDDYKSMKSVYSSAKIQKLTAVFEEVSSLNEIGFRQLWAAITIKMDEELLERIFDIYHVEMEANKDVKGIIPSTLMQAINKHEIDIFNRRGGNCLGIEESDGPLIMYSIHFRWSDAKDDERMNAMGNSIITQATAIAKERGLYHRYIYQNYANASQDVFAGYGERNRLRLKEIQNKYDPEGIFSRLQPGYFKL